MLLSDNLATWFWARDAMDYWGESTLRRIEIFNGVNLATAAGATTIVLVTTIYGGLGDALAWLLGAVYLAMSLSALLVCVYHGNRANLEGQLNTLVLLRTKLRLDSLVQRIAAEATEAAAAADNELESDAGAAVPHAGAVVDVGDALSSMATTSALLGHLAGTLGAQNALRPLKLFGVTLGPDVIRLVIAVFGALFAFVLQQKFTLARSSV